MKVEISTLHPERINNLARHGYHVSNIEKIGCVVHATVEFQDNQEPWEIIRSFGL